MRAPPPTMRDFAFCLGDHAVRVSDASCSGSGGSSASVLGHFSFQTSTISCLYRCRLSAGAKELLIRVVWSNETYALSLAIDAGPPFHLCMKGSRSYVSGDSIIGLYWDLSSAKYALGPEPVESFYVAVVAGAELALLLGDLHAGSTRKAEFSLVSRREEVLGMARRRRLTYATRFRGGGREHEMVIRCKHGEGLSSLSVCIDGRRVVHVARLQWNFRGNQMVFVGGSAVDVMWDVHDWCFGAGAAFVMLRTRSKLESRLWLDDQKTSVPPFSLLIQALNSTSEQPCP